MKAGGAYGTGRGGVRGAIVHDDRWLPPEQWHPPARAEPGDLERCGI